jgi:branched-chain amino acid transport system permease protein
VKLRVGLVLATSAAFAAAPAVLAEFRVVLLTQALVWAIAALAVWLLLYLCNLPSFGHAAFFGIGAYTAGLAATQWSIDNLFLVLLAAVAVTCVIAAPIAAIAVRLRSVSFLLVTLAFAEMLRALASRLPSLGGTDGLVGVLRPDAAPLRVNLVDPANYYYAVLAVVAAVVVLLWALRRSPFGAVLVGLRDSEHRMATLGYNGFLYRFAAFQLSAAIAATAGVLHAYLHRFVSPEAASPLVSARTLVIAVIAGAVLAGPLLVAVVLTQLEDSVSSHTERWLAILGLIYLAVSLAPRRLPRVRWRGRRLPLPALRAAHAWSGRQS